MNIQTARQQHVLQLEKMGFKVSKGLPVNRPRVAEVDHRLLARRLLAQKLVFGYVAVGEDQLSFAKIQNCINVNILGGFFTESEKKMVMKERGQAHRDHVDAVGWMLENMLGLSWVFGSKILDDVGLAMCGGEHAKRLLLADTPNVNCEIDAWVAASRRRPTQEVVVKEDYYYCWHNAARNIVHGGLANPTDLPGPVLVGLVQERRHALTFALSSCHWDETDLST